MVLTLFLVSKEIKVLPCVEKIFRWTKCGNLCFFCGDGSWVSRNDTEALRSYATFTPFPVEGRPQVCARSCIMLGLGLNGHLSSTG